jgi:hypothetical protein
MRPTGAFKVADILIVPQSNPDHVSHKPENPPCISVMFQYKSQAPVALLTPRPRLASQACRRSTVHLPVPPSGPFDTLANKTSAAVDEGGSVMSFSTRHTRDTQAPQDYWQHAQLPRSIEIFQIRWRLVLPGRHQETNTWKIVFVANYNMNVVFGTDILADPCLVLWSSVLANDNGGSCGQATVVVIPRVLLIWMTVGSIWTPAPKLHHTTIRWSPGVAGTVVRPFRQDHPDRRPPLSYNLDQSGLR